MKTPLGLYAYPLVMFGALGGLCAALMAGLFGGLGLSESSLYVALSLLTGWAAAARFDRLERRMTK
jgi:hypothetical protein